MRVLTLWPNSGSYRCIDYLLLGDWNTMTTVNTLIDAGGNENLVTEIRSLPTGVGKKPVQQIILTHSHFDHTSALKALVKEWNPRVYSMAQTPLTTDILRHGQRLPAGDGELLVMHTPLHSSDSVSLWNEKQGILFSGDVVLNIKSPGGCYPRSYVEFIDLLLSWDIRFIYSGHDNPVTKNIQEMLLLTMKNVLLSEIID